MNNTNFTVYWMYKDLHPNALKFTDMTKALAWMEDLRKRAKDDHFSAITMCSEMSDNVGKIGVDSVVDGRTPNGEVYDWNKDSRIGAMKCSKRIKPPVGTETVIVKFDEDL